MHCGLFLALYTEIRKFKARRPRRVGHLALMEQSRNTWSLVGKPEGKKSLGRPRRRWVDNIKVDLREVGCDTGKWIYSILQQAVHY